MGNVKRISITAKMSAWFLAIAILPLVCTTFISYRNSRKALESEVENSLVAIAENKTNQISSYLSDKVKDVTNLSQMSDLFVAMEKYLEVHGKHGVTSQEYNETDSEYRPFFNYYQKLFEYEDILLVSAEGEILFTSAGREDKRSLYEVALYGESKLAKVFLKTKEKFGTETSELEYYPDKNKVVAYIAAPVLKGASEFLGAVIAEISNKGLSDFMKDYSGLGKTGEAGIVTKSGDYVFFITPLRFDPDATFKRKVPVLSDEGRDMREAAFGKEGAGVTTDYRGREVLSIWRALPYFQLGVVVKMDTVEIFYSANRLRKVLFGVSFVLLFIVVIVAIYVARTITGPIKELTLTSREISDGNLSARTKIKTNDEVEELAVSFNQMTDSLVEAKAKVEEERKMIEDQAELLKLANQELDSFVYTVSHDLKAPLRGVASFAAFLEEDYKGKLDKEGKDYIDEIVKGTKRMNDLIMDLLKLSRISRIKSPFEDVDMNELIRSIIERISFDIKDLKVDLKIQDNMPIVRCDRIKMGEVFLNLINNAVKFSSKKKDDVPRVSVGYIDDIGFHRFYVQDNGIGIAPEHHKEVFGIFKRLHTNEEYEGTGAGLSIVKRVIDDHKGKIWIESELGQGTTFYFTIPKRLRSRDEEGAG